MPFFGPYAQFAPQHPQVDTMALIEEERRKKEEEEERKKKEAEAFLASVMQAQQQPAQPEMAEPEMLKQIMDRRFTPERAARLQQMRADTPDVIAQRLQDQYFGAPQGKLGKIGTAALKIATGVLGAPTPDFRKTAMEQWIAQNKMANDEETSEGRLAAAEIQGVTRQNATMKAAQVAQERNRTMMGMKLIDAKIKESQLEQQKLMDAYKATGMDADTALKRSKLETDQKLQQMLGAAFPLLGVKDAAQAAALAKQMAANPNLTAAQRAEIEAYGGNLLKFTEGLEQNKQYKPATPDRSITTPTPTLRTDPSTGSVVEIMQNKQRMIPGRPQQGMPNAASSAYFGQPIAPMDQQPQPQPQPIRPAPMQQPQPKPTPLGSNQAPTPKPTASLPQGVPNGAREINPEVRSIGRPPSENRYRSYFQSPNNIVLQSPGSKEVSTEDRAAMNQVSQSATSNSYLRDAYLSGDLDKVSSKWRAGWSVVASDKPIDTYYKIKDDTVKIETALNRLTTEETAAYLKKISGAQVSHQEYDRIKGMFPQASNRSEQNLQLGYWNTVVPGVLLQLEQAGALTGQNAQRISDALVQVAQTYSDKYMTTMQDIKAKGKALKNRPDLNSFMDLDEIATKTLQRAFPESVGTTISVPHSDRRFGIGTSYIYIPPASVRVQEMEEERKKERKKKVEEAKRLYREGKR